MRQNATPDDLTPVQTIALDALLAGSTITEAALTAGVDRTTVHRWKREPAFRAAYNARLEEFREAADVRLHRLRAKALEVVEDAVERGDLRSALTMVKMLAPEPSGIGPTTTEGVERAQREAEMWASLTSPFGGSGG